MDSDLYYKPLTTGVFHYYLPPLDGSRPYKNINDRNDKNYIRDTHEVPVKNIRGKEEEFTLDISGFQYYRHETRCKDFNTDADIKENYYPESIQVIKQILGASKVILFDHTVRRHRPDDPEESPEKRQVVFTLTLPSASDSRILFLLVINVHVDQTPNSAVARVYKHIPDEAEQLVKKRFQIINLWRPITHAAFDFPLGFCDTRTVKESDLMPMTLKFPGGPGETYGVKYNPAHEWVYLRGMDIDEMVLFKCYDSLGDSSICTFNAHSAFVDHSAPEGSPLRESIELRALVFYD
ncbi:hypothetical protein H0H92_011209 [Tricholoma furcatifolium]|nr:hypothetical protein H0H92_011209 [Tricholoma furcatifolium]